MPPITHSLYFDPSIIYSCRPCSGEVTGDWYQEIIKTQDALKGVDRPEIVLLVQEENQLGDCLVDIVMVPKAWICRYNFASHVYEKYAVVFRHDKGNEYLVFEFTTEKKLDVLEDVCPVYGQYTLAHNVPVVFFHDETRGRSNGVKKAISK